MEIKLCKIKLVWWFYQVTNKWQHSKLLVNEIIITIVSSFDVSFVKYIIKKDRIKKIWWSFLEKNSQPNRNWSETWEFQNRMLENWFVI